MRKRTRRKVWNPAFNPIRAAVFAQAYKGDTMPMEVQELITLGELKEGKINDQALHVMHCMAAISKRLAEDGIGPEVLPVCDQAAERLAVASRTREVTEELVVNMQELYELHRAQREMAGPNLYGLAAAPFCKLTS